MPIDPSIPLSYNPQPLGPDPNKLMAILQGVQQYKAQQQQAQQQNALRQILANPGSADKEGAVTPDALRQIMGVDPGAGLQIRNQMIQADQAKASLANTQSESAIRRLTLLDEGNTESVNIYDNAMKSGIGEPQARAQAQEFYGDYLKQLSTGGGFSGEQISQINPQFDPIRARSNQLSIQQRLAALKESREQSSATEKQMHDRAMESHGARDPAAPYVNDLSPVSGGPSTSQYVAQVTSRVQRGEPIEQAVVDQESGGKPQPVRTVKLKDGSSTEIGGQYQISKGTFDQYAKPGEKWGSQSDMDTVSRRALDAYKTKYNGDPARIATAWYSGTGNVTPPGEIKGKAPASPQTEAFTEFMRENPNATSQQQAEFIQRSRAFPRSAQAAAVQKYIQENPDATAEDISKFAAGMHAQSKATADFATGAQGKAINSFNVAISHLNTLEQATKALNNSDIKTFNSVANRIKEETGNPAPTNFAAIRSIVGDEIAKSVIGSGSSALGDREEIKTIIDKADTPQQLAGIIAKYKELMAGQLRGLKQQYEQTTGKKDFEARLAPETKVQLGLQKADGSAPASQKSMALPPAFKDKPDGTVLYDKKGFAYQKKGDHIELMK